MNKTIFTGSGVAVVTPMNNDGSINYDELGNIIDHQIEHDTQSIIICGTTGEASTFTDDEHVKAISYAVERVAGRVPVVAGTGSNDTAYAIWLAKEAKAAGADAQLQVTPYYNKTSQEGIIAHFNAIADATDLPVMLYNVPGRTGVNITPTTYAKLCKHPNIVATKEANGDIASVAHTRMLCGDELDIYSGNDDNILPILALGGKGVVSVMANVAPRQTNDICRLFFDGKLKESADIQIKMMGLIRALFADVNPIPVKKAMNLMGWKAGECRLPLVGPDEKITELLRREMTMCKISK